MANKKLPNGFNSWIKFYNYILLENPVLLTQKSILFVHCENDIHISRYKISVATIERNCWKEIHELRLKANFDVISSIRTGVRWDSSDDESIKNITELLRLLDVNNRRY
jgi:hypothetical protein